MDDDLVQVVQEDADDFVQILGVEPSEAGADDIPVGLAELDEGHVVVIEVDDITQDDSMGTSSLYDDISESAEISMTEDTAV